MIPHSKPFLGAEETNAALRVMESKYLAQNREVQALEDKLAQFLGVRGVVAVSSGTAGLHLALLALGAEIGTITAIPSYVCTALLNAVNYCGSEPAILDVKPTDGCLNPNELRLGVNKPEIVILPHMFGQPADVEKIVETGIPVIEDCAQSIGADVGGKPVGTFGAISVFSFYATKVLCAGEGGAVASDSEELLNAVRDFRDYDHKKEYFPRFNYKMTELQAAIAGAQLDKLPSFIERRRDIARRYDEAVESSSFEKPSRAPGNICFRYLLFHQDVEKIIEDFKVEGITAARPVFNPIHRYLGLDGYPGAEWMFQNAFSVPCYPALTDTEVKKICEAIKKSEVD